MRILGLISYPRTETTKFPPEIQLLPLVEAQCASPLWGDFSRRIISEWGGPCPRNGNKSDQAHPPIHPTKFVQLNLQVGDIPLLNLSQFVLLMSLHSATARVFNFHNKTCACYKKRGPHLQAYELYTLHRTTEARCTNWLSVTFWPVFLKMRKDWRLASRPRSMRNTSSSTDYRLLRGTIWMCTLTRNGPRSRYRCTRNKKLSLPLRLS